MSKWLTRLTAVLLFAVAAAKVTSLFSGMPLLKQTDQILHVRNSLIFLVLGIAEGGVAMFLLMGRSRFYQSLACFTLIAGIASYRISWMLSGRPSTCPCLGTIPHWLGLSDNLADGFLLATALFVQASGLLLLYQFFTAGAKAE